MKRIIVICLIFILCQVSQGEFIIPPDISNGIVESTTGESGGLSIHGVDQERFIKFIKSNWKSIAENIEILPVRPNSTLFKNKLSHSSVIIFGAACESLPPDEYLDFFDELIKLREQDRIPFHSIDRLMLGIEQKDCFFAVNWEHPRVQAIFKKVKKLTPPEEKSFCDYVDAASKGELADTYLENRSEDLPLPQTLPGIKLQRPWASLIKKYELRTGKKVPHDPKFDPRPTRHDGPIADSSLQKQTALSASWPWLALGAALFVMAFAIWKLRRRTMA